MELKTIIQSLADVPTPLSTDLALAQEVLRTNLGWQTGERVVVISDQAKLHDTGAVWLAATLELGAPVELAVIEGMTHSGQQPPVEVTELARSARIVILHTTYSLTHTLVSHTAANHGARVASLPGVSLEMMRRTLNTDYAPIAELGQRLQQALQLGTTVEITTPAGTELRAHIRTSDVYNDSGLIKPGEIGNLPAGEVFFAPLIDEALTGTVVIDATMADNPDHVLDEPIRITVTNGRATNFAGGAAARHLEELLNQFGPAGLVMAEIGIGTNPVVNPHGLIIEAEKALHTAHVAFGNSASIGGDNDVPIHLDGVMLNPIIRVDGQQLSL